MVGGGLYVFRHKWKRDRVEKFTKVESKVEKVDDSNQSSMEVQTDVVESEKCDCQDRLKKDAQTQTETRHAIWDYFRHNI